MIKEKNIVFILVSSTIVVIAWIGFTFYHTAVTSTLSDELTMQILPIPSTFNPKAISAILSKEQIPPTYTLQGNRQPTPQASDSGREADEETVEPDLEPTEEASSSLEIEGVTPAL